MFADLSEYALSNHWAIRSSIAINLEQNFDESNRQESDWCYPKLLRRQKYLTKATRTEKLIIEGRDTIGRSVHYRAFGGFLETMYAGAGGEILLAH